MNASIGRPRAIRVDRQTGPVASDVFTGGHGPSSLPTCIAQCRLPTLRPERKRWTNGKTRAARHGASRKVDPKNQDLSAEDLPNLRKFSWRSACRTVFHTVTFLLLTFYFGVIGIGIALGFRELRRYWFRRRIRLLRAPNTTQRTTEAALVRLWSSPMLQAQVLELTLLAVVILGLWFVRPAEASRMWPFDLEPKNTAESQQELPIR